MPNIVRLSARPALHKLPLRTGDVATDDLCFQLLNRVMELRTSAQNELVRVIALLGVAVSNTRRITDQISDSCVRKTIEDELVAIETTLKLAHEKALDL